MPVAVLIEQATDALARLDTDTGDRLAPFTSILLRTEAASSSQIEQLTASARAIAETEIGVRVGGNAAEIVANSDAMRIAMSTDTLDGAAIKAIHSVLMADIDPTNSGRWRVEQVWIGGSQFGPIGAEFIPPGEDRVSSSMDDLVTFMERDDLPVFVQAAIAHAQFETIHPFTDGNGRTGRALLHALLRTKGASTHGVIPISSGLLADVSGYFSALTAYREGQLTPIISQVCVAAQRAVSNSRLLTDELAELNQSWIATVRARRDSATWKIADLLLRHPVVDSTTIDRDLGAQVANNIGRYMAPLSEAGVVATKGSGRYQNWRAPGVLTALDNFAVRAGRREHPVAESPDPGDNGPIPLA